MKNIRFSQMQVGDCRYLKTRMRENDVEILNLLKNRKHNNRLTREEENKLKLLLRKKEC